MGHTIPPSVHCNEIITISIPYGQQGDFIKQIPYFSSGKWGHTIPRRFIVTRLSLFTLWLWSVITLLPILGQDRGLMLAYSTISVQGDRCK